MAAVVSDLAALRELDSAYAKVSENQQRTAKAAIFAWNRIGLF
jgi:hypothetical protein